MGWRTAKCLDVLLHQVDAAFPGRDKSSDGTLGDAAHAATKSEHNPDENGVVRARDITHDPAHGLDARKLAEALIASRDSRILYVISNAQICSSVVSPWTWRPYNGINAHRHHMHLSVVESPALYDDERPWKIDGGVVVQPPPKTPVVPLDQRTIDAIVAAAAASDLAHYSWSGRGPAPGGFIGGIAITFGTMLRKLAARDSAALAMVRIVNGKPDVFDHYEEVLTAAGMVTRGAPDIDRLRILFVILVGLAGRESSFGVDIGRDKSASNTTADTAEAGTWQQSRDSFAASGDPELPKLFAAYVGSEPDAVDAIFKRGIKTLSGALENFGEPESEGYKFQELLKKRPSIAALFAAVGMRTDYPHWGPLKERAAEVISEADALFRQVQEIVGATTTQRPIPMPDPVIPQPTPPPQPDPKPTPIRQPQTQLPSIASAPKLDLLAGVQYIMHFGEKAHPELQFLVDAMHRLRPDLPPIGTSTVATVPTPAPPPTAGSLLDRPSVQIGGLGLLATGISFVSGLDPNLTLLAGILSLATGSLGPTGLVISRVVMGLGRAVVDFAKKLPKDPQP